MGWKGKGRRKGPVEGIGEERGGKHREKKERGWGKAFVQ